MGNSWWAIKYDTSSGGGIAFVDGNVDKDKAQKAVKELVSHQYPVDEAIVIGKVEGNIDTAELTKVGDYEEAMANHKKYLTMGEKEQWLAFRCMQDANRYKELATVYFNGGDCC